MYKEAGDSLLGVFCLFGDGNSLLGVDLIGDGVEKMWGL